MTTNLQQFIQQQATPRQYTDMFAENRERQRLNMEKMEAEAKAAQEKAEREEKERQNKLTVAARNIETPSTVNMFDSDYKVAQRMAEHLRDNLDEMSKTPEGMREFESLSTQLTQFVQEGEEYYKTYYGSPEDEPSGSTWMSAFKRMNTPTNPYQTEGMEDIRTRGMYEQTLRDLDDGGAYDFEVSGGSFMIKKGEQSMGVGDFQRPKDPFSAALEPTAPLSPQDWFVTKMPRNTPTKEQAHMTAGALVRQDQRSQMDAARIYATENELDYKEVMNNPAQMQEAVDNYVNAISESWSTASAAKKREKDSNKKTKKEKLTDVQQVMSDSSFSVSEDVNVITDEAGNQQYVPEKTATLSWPSSNKVKISIGGGDSAYISNVRFDGTNYVVVLSDGQEIVANKQVVSGGKVSNNPAYEEIARQVDSELGQSGAFDSMIKDLYSRQSS